MKEIWKPLMDSEYYEVSNLGKIRCVGGTILRKDNKPYTLKSLVLKPFVSRCNYEILTLNLDINKKVLIHRAVLETFNPVENMENLQVNHIDGNKRNNVLSNLEWVTREENMQHAMKKGLFNPQNRTGEKHPMCKLTTKQVEEIREKIKSGKFTQREIAKEYNVSECTISEIKTKRTRKKD